MIIKLIKDGTIEIVPQSVPEPLDNIFISYVFPKGLNHLRPVLFWGGVKYDVQNRCISKATTKFDMRVVLYNGNEVYKEYRSNVAPILYVGYNIESIQPDICKRIVALEKEVRDLKERGDVI